jgi:NAD+ synthase (glutamine-hydrolysing)
MSTPSLTIPTAASPRFLKVGGAALNQTPLDWIGNRERIVRAIREAREQGVQVLVLPELAISGYGCEDAFHAETVPEHAAESLEAIAPETEGIAVALGLPVLQGDALFNGVALVANGEVHGIAAKQLLAGYGVYYEPRWFKAWPANQVGTCKVGRWDVPIGDLVFELDGVTAAFEICEDAWGRGHGMPRGASRWADLILNPSGSHFAFGKHETRRGIVLEGSRNAHAAYVYANLLGNESGRLIYDGTVMVAADGRMVAENRRFSFRDVSLQAGIVDLRSTRLERRRLSYPLPPEGWLQRQGVRVPISFQEPSLEAVRAGRAGQGMQQPPPLAPAPMDDHMSRYEEFAHAVSLGLWDYMRKSRSRGLILSLSGGVDSGSCAVLAWVMARHALDELGWPGVREALDYFGDWPEKQPDVKTLVARLLCTLYQGSDNSSDVTRNAAAGLAAFIGARHMDWNISPIVKSYEALAAQALGTELTWAEHDTALQNVQARVRSPGIWLIANIEGRLLLSTSNRSEVGVGYTTMDGDTSGGLAPIAGANKTFLRGWLRWMETDGLPGLEPIPVLAAINDQAPTAELRPLHRKQTDEADLMPYPVLDAIEQAAIRDRMTPVQVWRNLLATPLPGGPLEPELAASLVERFFLLWSRSQWKRERLAPSFHLDDENLDPKTWCRFPILSGNYELELEALRNAAGGAPRTDRAKAKAKTTPHVKGAT